MSTSPRKLPSGRWQARVVVDGVQHSIGTYPTKLLAQQATRDAETDRDRQDFALPTKMTVEEFATGWLDAEQARVRPKSDEQNRYCLSLALPTIGATRLDRVRPDTLERLYAVLLSRPSSRRKGGTLSPQTVRHVHRALLRMFAAAERSSLIARNPAARARPPKVTKVEMVIWTADQARDFLQQVQEDRFHVAYHLALSTGMRRGEIAALRWSSVDLEAGTLTVRRSRGRVGRQVLEGHPKSAKSRRTIALDDGTVAVLRRWRQRLREEELRALQWDSSGYVVCWDDGSPLDPDHLTRHLSRLIKRTGLPRIRFHDLRHTSATLGLEAGVGLKVMADRLGHSSVSVTADIYQHVTPELDRSAAARVGALLAP